MRGLACLWLALALFIAVIPARAQDDVRIDSLTIDLWPEFDQPSMLVMIVGTLPDSVPLPAELTLRVPAISGGPNAVAVEDPGGQLINAPFTTTPSGDDLLVTLRADAREFRVEYYDPTLATDGDARTYRFDWVVDYPVGDTTVRVQQPKGAEAVQTIPKFSSEAIGDYGLTYYTLPLGRLPAGQRIGVEVSYSKPDQALTSDAVGVTSPLPIGTIEPNDANPVTPVLAGVAAVGLALVAGGAVWYLRSTSREGRHSRTEKRRRRRRSTSTGRPEPGMASPAARGETKAQADEPPDDEPSAFCTQCGQPAAAEDRFCRKCGAALRTHA